LEVCFYFLIFLYENGLVFEEGPIQASSHVASVNAKLPSFCSKANKEWKIRHYGFSRFSTS